MNGVLVKYLQHLVFRYKNINLFNLQYYMLSVTSCHRSIHTLTVHTTHMVLYKKISSSSHTVREGSFARYIATNFKLHAWMGCVIIYYVTLTQNANLLRKSPVRESVREPVYKLFHTPRVSLWFIRFHALQTYTLTYLHTCKRSKVYGSQINSWGMNWFMIWLMTSFMNWWIMKWLYDICEWIWENPASTHNYKY